MEYFFFFQIDGMENGLWFSFQINLSIYKFECNFKMFNLTAQCIYFIFVMFVKLLVENNIFLKIWTFFFIKIHICSRKCFLCFFFLFFFSPKYSIPDLMIVLPKKITYFALNINQIMVKLLNFPLLCCFFHFRIYGFKNS